MCELTFERSPPYREHIVSSGGREEGREGGGEAARGVSLLFRKVRSGEEKEEEREREREKGRSSKRVVSRRGRGC